MANDDTNQLPEGLKKDFHQDERYLKIEREIIADRQAKGIEANDPRFPSIKTLAESKFAKSPAWVAYQQQAIERAKDRAGQDPTPKKQKSESWYKSNPTLARAKGQHSQFTSREAQSSKTVFQSQEAAPKPAPEIQTGVSLPTIPGLRTSQTLQSPVVVNTLNKVTGQRQLGTALSSRISGITSKVGGAAKAVIGKVFGQAGLKVALQLGGAVAKIFTGPIGWAITGLSLLGSKTVKKIAVGLPVAIGIAISSAPAAVGSAASAAAGSVGTAVGVSVIAGTVLVAFFMFIINSGAYIVPPSTGGIGSGETIPVGASCPIPGGVLLWGSYGTNNGSEQHGTVTYWQNQINRDLASAAYEWVLPAGTNCSRPSDCPHYGWAADFVYPGGDSGGKPVFFPFIEGESVTWETSQVDRNRGFIRAIHNGIPHEIYVAHIAGGPNRSGGESGEVMGTLDSSAHIHVELRINGEFVIPDGMCSGSTTSTPNSTIGGGENNTQLDASLACSENGGRCINFSSMSAILGTNVTSCQDVGNENGVGVCPVNEVCCN